MDFSPGSPLIVGTIYLPSYAPILFGTLSMIVHKCIYDVRIGSRYGNSDTTDLFAPG